MNIKRVLGSIAFLILLLASLIACAIFNPFGNGREIAYNIVFASLVGVTVLPFVSDCIEMIKDMTQAKHRQKEQRKGPL